MLKANCTNMSDLSSEIDHSLPTDLIFKSKGLHFCNLNVHHTVPKIDKIRVSLAHDNSPDIFVICETLLTASISDDLIFYVSTIYQCFKNFNE